ncbi:MAG: NAD(P)H-dependent glycerol-3-phosphate dehydrogenase [Deltaproteobacteria bacterium]|nr:MAG: NAD(P)H-dependent glycerol-3-phosphate dehydrogenase [Deltaproteobacteria bacterium]
MRVTVLGGGSWGTALADLLARKGHATRLWMRSEEVAAAINERHENVRYLKGHALPEALEATTDLPGALSGAEAVVVVVPTPAIREVMGRCREAIPTGVPIVAASKGIEQGSLMTVAEILADVLPESLQPYLAFLSGPSFAKEVCAQHPTAVTIAAWWPKIAAEVQALFSAPYFRTYTSHDVVGVEIAGALKNVIAIGAGIADGLGFGHNARAALITRGLAEIQRLGVGMGANPLTFMGLAGMGDLLLTCTGSLSRNRTVGFELGRGKKLATILDELGMVAEGVKTAKSARELAQREGVEMPITEEVYRVLYEDKDPKQAVVDLMTRDLKREDA